MKKSILSIFISLFAIFPMLGEESQVTLRIAYDTQPNPPYNLGNHQAESPGLSFELLEELGKRLKIKIEFSQYPWTRCLKNLQTNQSDAAMDGSFKLKRQAYGAYPESNGQLDHTKANNTQSYHFYVNKGNDLSWDGKSLKNYQNKIVAATRGYAVISVIQKLAGNQLEIHETDGTAHSLKLLQHKRVDAIADLDANVDTELLDVKYSQTPIVKLEKPVSTRSYFLILSKHFVKNHPELAEKIWQTIKELRESERFIKLKQEYYKKYMKK